MAFTDEGQQVMLAQRVKFDVFNDDHFFRVRREQRVIEDVV